MRTTQKIARFVRSLVENRAVLGLEEHRGRRVLGGDSTVDPGAAHVLIGPPGAGNIGDQAMVEAFVCSVDGPVVVVTRRPGDLRGVPAHVASRVTELPLPGLLYGLPHQHLRDLRRLAVLLSGARSVSVVGADIMDGAYWESPSVRRFRLARFAAERGIDARILGFSWNSAPTRASRRAMVAASQHLDLLARDSVSARRLRSDGGVRVVEVADIAFLTVPRPIEDEVLLSWIAQRRAEGKHIVLLNANGLIEASTGMVDTFQQLLDSPAAQHCAFVAVPHVSRGTPNDIELARRLARDAASPERVIAIDRLLSPGEIASLASLADLSVTGRMHLTILSTSVGTPVVTVGYQGKVGGLYELIGVDTWVDGGDPARIGLLALVERALRDLPALTESFEAAAPRLIEMARRNVLGLSSSGPAS